MPKPFIDNEQLQNLKQLLQSTDSTNQQLAFSLLQGFELPLCFLNELRTRYPMVCLACGFYRPFEGIRKISLHIHNHAFPAELGSYENTQLEALELDMKDRFFYLHEDPIPPIWHFISLKALMIKGNWSVHSLSSSIGQLHRLESLDIIDFGCNMHTMPEEICYLTRLKHLSFQNCRLEQLPQKIGRLKNLETLNLQGNWCLEWLPRHIRYLQKLKVLDLRGTGIRSVSGIESVVKYLPDTEILIHPLDVPQYA